MFFMIGIMGGRKNLNFSQEMTCTRCGQSGRYMVFMTYTTLSLFFIPIFKWGKRYYVQTSCCQTVYELDPEPGRLIERGERIILEPSDLKPVRGYEQNYASFKRCSNCGFTTDENFEYCPKCGNKLN